MLIRLTDDEIKIAIKKHLAKTHKIQGEVLRFGVRVEVDDKSYDEYVKDGVTYQTHTTFEVEIGYEEE